VRNWSRHLPWNWPPSILLILFYGLVWISAVYFGLSTDEAQLAVAVGLGTAAATSLHLADVTQRRQRAVDERQAELDSRTVPTQEALNIVATDMRKLREGSMRELVGELQGIREQLERISNGQSESDDRSSAP
jgi:uncharacterized protein YoaH (UPF0181 family)